MAVKKDMHAEEVSIISGGVKLEGSLFSEGNVRIDGMVLGNVTVNGNLTIGEIANIQGELKANNVVMGGKIEGKITALDTLRLESKSVLKGDLITRKLIIEDGAFFEGRSMMNNKNGSEMKNEG